MRRSVVVTGAIASALAMVMLATVPADASRRKVRHRHHVTKVEKPEPMPTGTLTIVVSINQQKLTLFSDGKEFVQAPVSTGRPGHSTPTGVFSVIEKERFHRSNLYAGAPMPFMQRITWSGVALHAGYLPGYPASHGCIRMPSAFAQKLYRYTRVGARVIVARDPVVPVPIVHPKLFDAVPQVATTVRPLQKTDLDATLGAALIRTAETVDPERATDAVAPEAVALRPAVLPAGDSPSLIPVSATAAAPAVASDPAPPTVLQEIDSGTPASAARPAAADGETARAAPEMAGTASTTAPHTGETDATAPSVIDPFAADAAALEPTVVLPVHAPLPPDPKGQISVFVSRATGKLYVRKGDITLFDAPVVIRNPDQPLGTHVFTALGWNAADGTMRWTVTSMPSSHARAAPRRGRRHRHAEPDVAATAAVPDAAAVLDRIDMPADAVARISRMIGPQSSLIVSDNRLSSETGEYTDFIVLTR